MSEERRPAAALRGAREAILANLAVLAVLAFPVAGCGRGGGITPVRTAFNRGVYHASRGAYDEAIAEYRAALEEDEGDHRSRFNLASALEAKADEAEERGEADAAARLREEAEEEYRRLLARVPDDLRASINLAACELRRGERAGALARLRVLAEKRSDSPLPRVALAAHLFREGEPAALAEAQEHLEAALAIEPASLEANMLLGDVAAARGDRGRARAAYGKALERDPDDLATLLALARLETAGGDRGRAATLLARVLFIEPEDAAAHRLLADVLEAEGDLEGAVTHLWRARALEEARRTEGARSAEDRRRLLELYERLAKREAEASREP